MIAFCSDMNKRTVYGSVMPIQIQNLCVAGYGETLPVGLRKTIFAIRDLLIRTAFPLPAMAVRVSSFSSINAIGSLTLLFILMPTFVRRLSFAGSRSTSCMVTGLPPPKAGLTFGYTSWLQEVNK